MRPVAVQGLERAGHEIDQHESLLQHWAHLDRDWLEAAESGVTLETLTHDPDRMRSHLMAVGFVKEAIDKLQDAAVCWEKAHPIDDNQSELGFP